MFSQTVVGLSFCIFGLLGTLGCGGDAASARLGAGAAAGAGGSSSAWSSSGGTLGATGSGGSASAYPLQATAIAVGSTHSCALLVSGEVACWGGGSSGQLGDGIAMAGYSRATAAKIPGLTNVKGIRAGGDTTCAILERSVVCWGDGTYGQLGNGMAAAGYFKASPVGVLGLTTVSALSIGDTGACAVSEAGTAYCWGLNTADGWLGFISGDCGPYPNSTTSVEQPCEKAPRVVPSVASAVGIATSSDHCCATLNGGGISCWGADTYGQLGDGFSGTTPHDPSPVAVENAAGAFRVAVGTSFTCALSGTARTVSCWGDNSYGQLGIMSEVLDSNQSTPVPVSLAPPQPVVDLDSAESATCVVVSDGTVRCWGEASSLFSPNSTTPTDAPLVVPGIANAVSVRTSGAHACALIEDHTVQCWGRDDEGQLGNGQQTLGSYTPTPVLAP